MDFSSRPAAIDAGGTPLAGVRGRSRSALGCWALTHCVVAQRVWYTVATFSESCSNLITCAQSL